MNTPSEDIRVLIVAPHLERTQGGVATFVKELLRQRPQWALHISQAESGKGSTLLDQLMQLLSFAKTVRNYDVAYLQASEYRSVFRKSVYAAVARLMGRKSVMHLHAASLPHPQSKNFKLAFVLVKMLDVQIICLSDYWQGLVGKGGVKNSYVVPNPVLDTALFDLKKETKPTWPIRIAFLGRVGERKGTDLLIDAICSNELQSKGIDVAIAGDGEVERFRTRLGRNRLDVRFLGWIDSDDRHDLLSWADVVCLPSRAEGMPLALIEGAASANILIGSDIPPITSAFRDFGKGCLFFESGNSESLELALRKVQDMDRDQIRHLGLQNRKIARERLSLEVFFNSIERIIQKQID